MIKEKTPLLTKIAYTILAAAQVGLVAIFIVVIRVLWLESWVMALSAAGIIMISLFPLQMISARLTFLAIREIWQGTYMRRFINKRQQH